MFSSFANPNDFKLFANQYYGFMKNLLTRQTPSFLKLDAVRFAAVYTLGLLCCRGKPPYWPRQTFRLFWAILKLVQKNHFRKC